MDTPEIDRLALAYQNGDTEAFRMVVDRMSRSLIATAYRYTRDWESARDLTQDTWVKVHDAINRYDRRRSFLGWVYAIHRNTCLSHLRRSWVRRETPMDPDALGALDTRVTPEAPDDGDDFFKRLFRAMATLSESQRRVFCHVDIEQVDQREAARMLNVKFNTLRSTLHFARKRLARVLREMEETE